MGQLLPNSGPCYDSSLPKVQWLAHCQAPLYLHASHLYMSAMFPSQQHHSASPQPQRKPKRPTRLLSTKTARALQNTRHIAATISSAATVQCLICYKTVSGLRTCHVHRLSPSSSGPLHPSQPCYLDIQCARTPLTPPFPPHPSPLPPPRFSAHTGTPHSSNPHHTHHAWRTTVKGIPACAVHTGCTGRPGA